MDSNSNSASSRGSTGEKMDTSEESGSSNNVKQTIVRIFDSESYAKFQQVLEYLDESLYEPLYYSYNANIKAQLQMMLTKIQPSDCAIYFPLKIKFYTFRFISNVGVFLLEKLKSGDGKAEENYFTLIKILLYHALTSKADTAILALVELDQLCYKRSVTLQSLYHDHRTRFLRLIIKAILFRITSSLKDPNNSDFLLSNSDTNGSLAQNGRCNTVIKYMTRALEVFNVATISSDDLAQSLIITTNLLHKEKFDEAIKIFLDHLASFQHIDISTLICGHIQAIVVSLLLKRKLSHYDMSASLRKLCSFCDKTPGELLATKFTFIKGRLLLDYAINSKIVTDAIYYLSKFEKEEHEQPFEDEFDEEKHFIDYLFPSMIGILLGVDAHLTSIRKNLSSEDGINCIKSLTKLISILNLEQVRAIHVKLLSTLSLLLSLRPMRDCQHLNIAIRDAWAMFVAKLDSDIKLDIFVNICITLFDLVEDCPEEVSCIYADLLLNNDQNPPREKLRLLFFIPNILAMKKVYDFLTPYVKRADSVSSLQQLQESLDCVLPLLKYESTRSKQLAICKIKQLLKSNQALLMKNMLANTDEPLDGMISKTIESLIALSSTQDEVSSVMIAECLGLLGAINPVRLDHLIYGEFHDTNATRTSKMNDPNFVMELIEFLTVSLFSDQRSESESANYALQVVVSKYHVLGQAANAFKKLSADALRACRLCQNTNYSGAKKAQPDISTSVYEKFKSENQYSYKEWLDKFSLTLILSITSKQVQELFYACSYIFRFNQKFAEYLLPIIVIQVITQQTSSAVAVVKKEFLSIIDEDVGVSTQDLDSVYTEDIRGSIETLHFQCANMIFCILDALNRARGIRDTKRQHNEKSLIAINSFINSMPKDKLAMLSTKCRLHARALCYIEQYLFENEYKQLDKYATMLQRIYIALEDTYEATGVEVVRNTSTTLSDDVASYEAYGKFDKAFICSETFLRTLRADNEIAGCIADNLRSLSNQGYHQRLAEKSEYFIDHYSHLKRNILPHAIEASWKLGQWDELSNYLDVDQVENLLEISNVSQGYLLQAIVNRPEELSHRLKTVHQRLMKPLSIAMMDRSAYFRGYQNLLALHRIGDFTCMVNLLPEVTQELDQEKLTPESKKVIETGLNSIINEWRTRNKLVQPSLLCLEPLLEWQRSMCYMFINRYSFCDHKTRLDIGKMWLQSADLAREARSFDRSFHCLTQAKQWFGNAFDQVDEVLQIKYYMGHAKLDWDQGDQTKAIRGLKQTLYRLKDHALLTHLSRRSRDKNIDPFPTLDLNKQCIQCSAIDEVQRESFAELKMLLTHYCEEAAAGIPELLFFMYEECVHLGVNQEETYFRLARYYDKLHTYYIDNPKLCGEQIEEKNIFDASQRFSQNLISGDKEEVYTRLMEHSIIAFGKSLKCGVRYLRESMPRMLNIWYDLGTKKAKAQARSIGSRIESSTRFIDSLREYLPPYYFLTAMSILLSRVCHPNSGVSKKTCQILDLLLQNYPHQVTWQMIALLNDNENEDRKRAAKALLINQAKSRLPEHIIKIVNDTIAFSRMLVEICYNHSPQDRSRPDHKRKKLGSGYFDIKEIVPNALAFDFARSRLLPPIESCIRPVMPTNCSSLQDHTVFPDHHVSYIKSINSQIRIFNSLQQPRQINLLLENGKVINLLCKSGDDLRKDSRCVEFLDLLNRILRRDSLSNARFFDIQTFLVLPLESGAGTIEMVPNCETMRNVIEKSYKERQPNFVLHDAFLKKVSKDSAPQDIHEMFMKNVLPKTMPPVLPTWFLRQYTEPTAWYMARLAFTRSAAVVSMGGYIIGLGDRHLDNILIDTRTGKVVHVDFNLLFHQGESLPTPERVPFRLTHNMVAAFGSMGTEGNFRRVCEIAMRVMRKEKDALLTTLKPFMHDPCSEWTRVRDVRERANRLDHEDKHAENKSAKLRIEVTERKLKGYPRSKKFKPLTLIDSYSVEAQVDNLIEEATDTYNLAQMYFGWCAHV